MRYCLMLLALLGAAAPLRAENRAVIIGNADYSHAPDLAGSDTGALAEVIRKAGFVTRQGVDLSSDGMRRTLDLLAMADPAPGARIVMLSGRFLTAGAETWFMGTEADKPGPLAAAGQGVPLGLVMQLIADAGHEAVLLLGTDQQTMPHESGLESGIGTLAPPPRVSVITGSPEATARALRELAAGRTLARAVAAGRGLKLLPGGNAQLTAVRPTPPSQALPAVTDAERSAWAEAVTRDTVRAYATYLEGRPDGAFAGAAQGRLAALRQQGQGRIGIPSGMPPAQAERALTLDRNARTALQLGLARLGLEPGAPDGLWGRKTRKALQTWQSGQGFEPTGYLTGQQLAELRRQIAAANAVGDGAATSAGRDRIQRLWSYLLHYPQNLLEAAAGQKLPPQRPMHETGSAGQTVPEAQPGLENGSRSDGVNLAPAAARRPVTSPDRVQHPAQDPRGSEHPSRPPTDAPMSAASHSESTRMNR